MIIRARRKEIKNVWKIPEILKIERTPVETFFITALIWLFVSNILWILVTSLYEILALWNHKKSSFKPILLTSFLCRCSRDVNLNSEEIVRHFSGICFYTAFRFTCQSWIFPKGQNYGGNVKWKLWGIHSIPYYSNCCDYISINSII